MAGPTPEGSRADYAKSLAAAFADQSLELDDSSEELEHDMSSTLTDSSSAGTANALTGLHDGAAEAASVRAQLSPPHANADVRHATSFSSAKLVEVRSLSSASCATKLDHEAVDEQMLQKLEARAQRFGLSSQPKVGCPTQLFRSLDEIIQDVRPRKRTCPGRSTALARVEGCLTALVGCWTCDYRGKAQAHIVEAGPQSRLSCCVWERERDTLGPWRRKNDYDIAISLDGSQILWGMRGKVRLDIDSTSCTQAVWRSEKGTVWVWRRTPARSDGRQYSIHDASFTINL